MKKQVNKFIMKYRKPLKITQRTSSVTNSFVQAVIPWVQPTIEQRAEALAVLGMSEEKIRCAYCGGLATDWDHLRPLVKGKRPTGYISDYKNLVPSCGRCNQSKGASDWKTWIEGTAIGSPRGRGILDLSEQIAALGRFEEWGGVRPIDLRALVPADIWETHWQNLERLERDMVRAQEHALLLQQAVQNGHLKPKVDGETS